MKAENLKEFLGQLNNLKSKIDNRFNGLNLPGQETMLSDLKRKLENPKLWGDDKKIDEVRVIQMQISSIERKLDGWTKIKSTVHDLMEYTEIGIMEKEESLLPDLLKKATEADEMFNALDLESLLTGPDDLKNAFLNIHPGAGGTESHDWADMLFRAYSRWGENKGFKVDIIDYQAGEEAGIKNVTLYIQGENAYGFLKAENGVHRLVRISPFDSNKRRHTSFVSVHVSPEISDDVEVDINEKDLRIDTYRSSGSGGQHINKTDSAVRITHNPTGIVVACQNERSQTKNKSTAMKMLKARLYELAQEEKQKEIASKSGEKKDISWGNQIRSYVFHPYNMVKDLRTDYETADVHGVMNGAFDPFIDSFLRQQSAENN
ncbi:MAG: peptide chain release factor 2 [Spirochaetia bacterium]|nr:peptide chain release factor 2 [Spirochaetia bacterium]